MTSQRRFMLSGPPSILGQPGLWQSAMPCAMCQWYVSVPVLWLLVPAAEHDARLCADRHLPACNPAEPHRLQGQGERAIGTESMLNASCGSSLASLQVCCLLSVCYSESALHFLLVKIMFIFQLPIENTSASSNMFLVILFSAYGVGYTEQS